jgi:hypothetical protein
LTATYTGFVNGDTPASLTTPVTLATAASALSGAGAYPITASAASHPNYSTTFVNGTLTVKKAPLSIAADNKTKAYGAANPPLTASYGGLVNNDSADVVTGLSLATSASASSPVGSYPITASGGAAANYEITFQNGTLVIAPAPLVITADDKKKLFGAENPPLTASYAGFVNGETFSDLDTPVVLSTTADASSPIGSYVIKASGAADSNYVITFVDGTLTISGVQLVDPKITTGGVIEITIDAPSSAGTLHVEYSTDLAQWTDLVPQPVIGSLPATIQLDSDSSGDRRFYRVRIGP